MEAWTRDEEKFRELQPHISAALACLVNKLAKENSDQNSSYTVRVLKSGGIPLVKSWLIYRKHPIRDQTKEAEEINYLEKEVYFALRYLQDVVEKNTVELLAGSTTVVIENIFVLDNALQNTGQDFLLGRMSMQAELKKVHAYLAVLVHWSDQVLLRRSDQSLLMRRHVYVLPAIHSLREHIRNVVKLYHSSTKIDQQPATKRPIKLTTSASTESLAVRSTVRTVPAFTESGSNQSDGSFVPYKNFTSKRNLSARPSSDRHSVNSLSSHSLQSRSPSPQLLPDMISEKTPTDSGISLNSIKDTLRCVPTMPPRLGGRNWLHSQSTVSYDKFPVPLQVGETSRSFHSLNDRMGFAAHEIKGSKVQLQRYFSQSNGVGRCSNGSLCSSTTTVLPSFTSTPSVNGSLRDYSPLMTKSPADRRVPSGKEKELVENLYEPIYCELRDERVPPLPPKKQRNVKSYVEVFGQDSFSGYEKQPSAACALQMTEICHETRVKNTTDSLPRVSHPFASQKNGNPWPTVSSSQNLENIPKSSAHLSFEKLPVATVPSLRDASSSLIYSTNAQGKSELKGGTVNGLIVEATAATKKDFEYQEAFIATYRTFISSEDLIAVLLRRHAMFSTSVDHQEKSAARTSFALLLRLIDELTMNELFQSSIILTLLDLIYHLLTEGDLAMARGLRRKILDKYDHAQKSRTSTLVLMGAPRKNRRIGYLLDFKSQDIAEQMTLLDAEHFTRVEGMELLCWTKEQSEDTGPNLTCFTGHFNKVSFWARTRILEQTDHRDREKYLVKFIKIMKCLRKMQNFNSYLAILAAVDSAPICRLDCSKPHMETLKEFRVLIDSSQSFRAYRTVLAGIEPPCIPYIGIALQDLTFVNENNDWLDGEKSIVNFGKRWQQYHILDHLTRFQRTCQYPFVRNDIIVQFFNKFDNYLSEDHLWKISEAIKPRTPAKGLSLY